MEHAVILLVDDNPDQLQGLTNNLRHAGVRARALHPQEVSRDDLAIAHLVLVDLRLDDWPERDAATAVALSPRNGLAVAGILRTNLNGSDGAARQPAFALHTAHPEDLSPFLPAERRLHAVARTHNLEWVFSKSGHYGEVPREDQMVALAAAVAQLPPTWYPENADANRDQAAQLFNLDGSASWFDTAWEDVERCCPPLHELSSESHGLAFLRWFLQRVLPYPCFLWDALQLSVRLDATPASVAAAMNGGLAQFLEPSHYHGILSGFTEPRWWRSGVEASLWEISGGASFDPDVVRTALAKDFGVELEPLRTPDPVICVRGDLYTRDTIAPVAECVRVQPDDWPPYADQAWAHIDELHRSPRLSATVLFDDRDRLQLLHKG
jgi:hypothetical protein